MQFKLGEIIQLNDKSFKITSILEDLVELRGDWSNTGTILSCYINKKTIMNQLLWLDDVRDPFTNKEWLIFSPIDEPYAINWVKSYDEFCDWITNNGLPSAICFDHDLGDDSKDGYECAKWLVEYCLDYKLSAPLFNIQSANPVGKENIKILLENFDKLNK